MNDRDIALLNFKDTKYCCIFGRISNSQAINPMQKIDFTTKVKRCKTQILLSHIKITE